MSLQIDLFASAGQLVNNVYKFTDERLHPEEKPRLYKQTIKILQAFVDEPNSVSSFEGLGVVVMTPCKMRPLTRKPNMI